MACTGKDAAPDADAHIDYGSLDAGVASCLDAECSDTPNAEFTPDAGKGCLCPTNECRNDRCIPRDPQGELCEFDASCDLYAYCIGGRCSRDPEAPTPCPDGSFCPGSRSCGALGLCECTTTADCPPGWSCTQEGCMVQETCILHEDCTCGEEDSCPQGLICLEGLCQGNQECGISHPDYAGSWSVETELHLRDSLPPALSTALDSFSAIYRFVIGDWDPETIPFGFVLQSVLAGILEDHVAAHVAPYADAIDAVLTLNDSIGTWHIRESIEFSAGLAADRYRGQHHWNEVRFEYRDTLGSLEGPTRIFRGTPEEIFGRHLEPAAFEADAVCGMLHIHPHPVAITLGPAVVWILDTLVFEASERELRTLSDLVNQLLTDFCESIGDALPQNSLDNFARNVCLNIRDGLLADLERSMSEIAFDAELFTLRGAFPTSEKANLIEEGIWYGTFGPGEFQGQFQGMREQE